MAELSISEVTAPFLGNPLTAHEPGKGMSMVRRGVFMNAHRVIITDFQYYPAFMAQFGVTPRMKEQWERAGTEIYMTILLEADNIRDIQVEKFRESGASARPVTRSLKLNTQELRIVRRVLDHLTKA